MSEKRNADLKVWAERYGLSEHIDDSLLNDPLISLGCMCAELRDRNARKLFIEREAREKAEANAAAVIEVEREEKRKKK